MCLIGFHQCLVVIVWKWHLICFSSPADENTENASPEQDSNTILIRPSEVINEASIENNEENNDDNDHIDEPEDRGEEVYH